jgi:hypothetical protein
MSAAMVYRRDSGKVSTRDSVTPAGSTPSDKGLRDTGRFAQPLDTTKGPGTNNGGGAPSGTPSRLRDVAATLDSLEKVVSGDVTPNEATRVIRTLDEMKGRIKGNEQLVQAAMVDALAESSRRDNAAACRALRGVKSIAPATRRARSYATTVSLSC